jgi:deoxyribose-phosphate aldolase
MSKTSDLLSKYNFLLSDQTVKSAVEQILSQSENFQIDKSALSQCLGFIDITSLNTTDNETSISEFVDKVNHFSDVYPHLPNVAAICVYPSFVSVVKSILVEDVAIASVAGGFPSSQTFTEVKVAEAAMACMEGANEIDIVLPTGKFFEEKYEEIAEEIHEIKSACRGDVHLKVIIESGSLRNCSEIKKASVLSIISGADFIKTSTGKTPVSATPEAVYVMCTAIKEWFEKTNQKVGIKVSGGVSKAEDAVAYYSIVKAVLGDEWLNSSLFRFGASRLANSILSEIENTEISYF